MSRVKGKGPKVTAKFNGKAKKNCPRDMETKTLVLLSIRGNEFCAGEYLGAMIQEAIKEPNKEATFLIADEVYWHNLRTFDGESEKDFKAKAIALGDSYFEENLSYFLSPLQISEPEFNQQYHDKTTDEKIKIINEIAQTKNVKSRIVRWNDWVNNESAEFTQNKVDIMHQYKEGTLNEPIELTAKKFAERHKEEGGIELWTARSRSYLTEESPAIMWIVLKNEYNFIVYPGEMIAPFLATKNFFVTKNPDSAPSFTIFKEKPELYGNWLEAYFTRSYPKATKSEPYGFFNNPKEKEAANLITAKVRTTSAAVEDILRSIDELSYFEKLKALETVRKLLVEAGSESTVHQDLSHQSSSFHTPKVAFI